jgi:glycerol-3-phosphate dehydrogenase (NAD(P)+)
MHDLDNQNNITQGPIAVLGAGSWGTALAIHLSLNSNSVRLFARNKEQIDAMRQSRVNQRYLPGIELPSELQLFSDLEQCLHGVSEVMVAVPSTQFEAVLLQLKQCMQHPWRLLWVTKGLDKRSNILLSELVSNIFSDSLPMAMLSGPSFAKEVALQMPTAVSISGNDVDWCHALVARFHADNFRVYYNEDFIGMQLCAVGKNVLAIAVGIAEGMGFGANSKAALITRGMVELQRLLVSMQAASSTILSLAGVGDIVLTCTDNQSRNRRFGVALGAGASIEDAEQQVGMEIEGRNNVSQLRALARRHAIDMPVVEQVYLFLRQEISRDQLVSNLVGRPSKSEFE